MHTHAQLSEWAKKRWAKYRIPVADRFWKFVDKKGPNDCWLWKGAHHRYGMFVLDGRGRLAHRVAYELTHGKIPEGMCACHSCDNGMCCNPNHIWIGTHSENIKDGVMKGRIKVPTKKGLRFPYKPRNRVGSKYPDEFVAKLRSEFIPYKFTAKDISEKYGIPWHIVRNLIYVGNDYTLPHIRKRRMRSHGIT